MAIEFRCAKCNKLLRTDDETAGRQAACPECGTLNVVPAAGSTAGAPSGSPPPGAGAPFAAGPGVGSAPSAANPYQSPLGADYTLPPGQPDAFASQRLSGPAVSLMVVAILGILGDLFVAGMYGLVLGMVFTGQPQMMANGANPHDMVVGSVIAEIVAIIGLIANIVVFLGARKMNKLESYVLAVIAATIAVIPGLSPCCILGLPFGIWALVVLCNSSVKSAFRS